MTHTGMPATVGDDPAAMPDADRPEAAPDPRLKAVRDRIYDLRRFLDGQVADPRAASCAKTKLDEAEMWAERAFGVRS